MFVGLDVHKESIDVTVADTGGEVRHHGSMPVDLEAVKRLMHTLRGPDRRLHFAYEAGPCGLAIHRYLTDQSEACVVVSPTGVPKAGTRRIKTDRRDGQALARAYRAGDLTPIYIPAADDEAMRGRGALPILTPRRRQQPPVGQSSA